VIKFDESTFLGLESAGVAVIAIERSHGEDGAVSIQYSTADGSADAGSDYQSTTGTLHWASGDGSTRIVTIPLYPDDVAEGNETVHLSLSNPTGGVGIDTERGAAVLTILDAGGTPPGGGGGGGSNPGFFKFAESSYQVVEGQSFALITVERSNGEDGSVAVDYVVTAGSATEGEDFQATGGTLSWANNDGSTKTFQVPIFDDAASEDSETISLTLVDPTNGATIDPTRGSALLSILDNDASQANCVPGAGTLCLLGGRFRAEITYRTANVGTGQGHAVPLSGQAGLFWFFDAANVEMLVKVIDGCGVPGLDSFWVFYAATTNVDFTMTVTDTQTGVARQYRNPLGLAATPIQDVTTFRSCPQ
jgi:hypothetical protein